MCAARLMHWKVAFLIALLPVVLIQMTIFRGVLEDQAIRYENYEPREFDWTEEQEESQRRLDPSVRPMIPRESNVRGQRNPSILDKPTLYLHVGPPKTATTLLQCALCADGERTQALLLQDGYTFIGTCPYRACGLRSMPDSFLPHRFGAWFSEFGSRGTPSPYMAEWLDPRDKRHIRQIYAAAKHKELSPALTDRLAQARAANLNAILIYEGCSVFEYEHMAALAQTLQEDWNVQVLASYRRLFEWLPSKLNSMTKRKTRLDWPERGRLRTKPFDFDDIPRPFRKMLQQIENSQRHPTDLLLHNYGVFFDNVQLIDMYHLSPPSSPGSVPFLERFLCEVLQDAHHACTAAQKGELEVTASNPTVNLDYDMLAIGAYDAGLLSDSAVRRKTGAAIQHFVDTDPNTYHIPQKCLSRTKLKRLYQLSLLVERQLLKDGWNDELEREHHQSFQAAVESGKYCSVDVDKALQMDAWKSLFMKHQSGQYSFSDDSLSVDDDDDEEDDEEE